MESLIQSFYRTGYYCAGTQNTVIPHFKFASNVGYKAINLFQFYIQYLLTLKITESAGAPKCGARGNCPVCLLLNPALWLSIPRFSLS